VPSLVILRRTPGKEGCSSSNSSSRERSKGKKWGCTTGNAATVAHSTKKTTSGKDSVIEGQPLLLFM
jgi:hypothetical protein